LEGGNIIPARRADGSMYVIVGADTIALNQSILAGNGKSPFTTEETERRIAEELGIEPSALVVVPQPGAFHLDVAMTAWEPGTVLINDARAVLGLQEQRVRETLARLPASSGLRGVAERAVAGVFPEWSPERLVLERALPIMREVTAQRAAAEDAAVAALEGRGLRVIRAPARFMRHDYPAYDAANFVNGEGGIGAHGVFFAAAGGPAWTEAAFASAVGGATEGTVSLYFVTSAEIAAMSLAAGGSLGCRVKRTR
jgi:hypothetical protein